MNESNDTHDSFVEARSGQIATMMERSRRVLIGAAVFVLSCLVLYVAIGRADTTPEPAVLLARLCVNEAGFNTLDCAAIGHIRMRSARANHRTITQELLYQHGGRSLRPDRATNIDPADTRPWIGDLGTTTREPRAWPSNVDWMNVGLPRWEEILDTARRTLAGTERDPCRAGIVRPNTWGGPSVDAVRLARPGWQVAHCGSTRNVFGRWGAPQPPEPAADPGAPQP